MPCPPPPPHPPLTAERARRDVGLIISKGHVPPSLLFIHKSVSWTNSQKPSPRLDFPMLFCKTYQRANISGPGPLAIQTPPRNPLLLIPSHPPSARTHRHVHRLITYPQPTLTEERALNSKPRGSGKSQPHQPTTKYVTLGR